MATTTRTVLSAPVETPDRVWMDNNREILILGRMRYTSRSRRWEAAEQPPQATMRGSGTTTHGYVEEWLRYSDAGRCEPFPVWRREQTRGGPSLCNPQPIGTKVPNPQWLDPSETERSFVDIAMTPEKV